MRKIVFIFLFLVFISGCNHKKTNNVETIIENKKDVLIAINYPNLGYNKLDNNIKKYVDTTYRNFKNKYTDQFSYKNQAELNIDYEVNKLNDRYINIVIKSFINHSSLAHPINMIKTFNYDIAKNKLFNLNYLISDEELNKLIPLIKKELISKYKDCILIDELNSYINKDFSHYTNFTFDDDNLTLYFEPYLISAGYCDIVSIDISLDKVNLKLPFERGVFKEEASHKIIPKYRNIDINKPVIALTFDDGPSKYTKAIIDLLKENDAVATFFVIGNKINLYKNTIRELYQNGNEIGNHSYNHKWLTKITDDELLDQINKTQNIIKETTGFTPKLFRPTYGSINKHIRNQVKLDIVMWDIDTYDWKTTNPKKIAKKVINNVKDDDIILMHDNHKQSYESLKYILPELKKQGYQFVTVSELKEIGFIKQSRSTTRSSK